MNNQPPQKTMSRLNMGSTRYQDTIRYYTHWGSTKVPRDRGYGMDGIPELLTTPTVKTLTAIAGLLASLLTISKFMKTRRR